MIKKLTKRLNGQRGFTLIELLVVIVILGIIAAIAVPNVIQWIGNSQDEVDTIQEEIDQVDFDTFNELRERGADE